MARETGKILDREFGHELKRLALPSAPERLVGRLRADHALEHGIRYVLVSHNTKMGAAKGAVLTPEYLVTAGYV